MLRGSWKLYQPVTKKGEVELYDLSKDPGERVNVAERKVTKDRAKRADIQASKSSEGQLERSGVWTLVVAVHEDCYGRVDGAANVIVRHNLKRRVSDHAQPVHDCIDVNRCRVERGHAGNGVERQEQRQLGPAQDHAVDVLSVAKATDDRDDALANVVAEHAFDHLVGVVIVNEDAFRFVWNDDVDVAPAEAVGIHGCFHREARAKQRDASQAAATRFVGACLDDADERNGRARTDVVEYEVRHVGCDRAEIRAGAGEPVDRCGEVIGERRPVRLDEAKDLAHIDAVDDERRRGRGIDRLPRGNDPAIVVDGRFGSKSADQPDRVHSQSCCQGLSGVIAANIGAVTGRYHHVSWANTDEQRVSDVCWRCLIPKVE